LSTYIFKGVLLGRHSKVHLPSDSNDTIGRMGILPEYVNAIPKNDADFSRININIIMANLYRGLIDFACDS